MQLPLVCYHLHYLTAREHVREQESEGGERGCVLELGEEQVFQGQEDGELLE